APVVRELEQLLAEKLGVGLRLLPQALDQAEIAGLTDQRDANRPLVLRGRVGHLEEIPPGSGCLRVLDREVDGRERQHVAGGIAVRLHAAGAERCHTGGKHKRDSESHRRIILWSADRVADEQRDDHDRSDACAERRERQEEPEKYVSPAHPFALSTSSTVNGFCPGGAIWNDRPQWPTITSAGAACP